MAWLKVASAGRPIGVDREAGALRGFVVAQQGAFRESDPRGEFDGKSLRQIAQSIRREPKGLKSRFTHPDLSNDGLGKFLGRVKDPFVGEVSVKRDGKDVSLEAIRADLHFSESAFDTPSGDLAGYVMRLAEEDADALSSSLVIEPIEEFRLNTDGTRKQDENGDDLPPLWRVGDLHAADIVDEGAAVDGLLGAQLSAEGLPDAVVRQAAELLQRQFGGKDRLYVEERLRQWVDRVLDRYWPREEDLGPSACDLRRRLQTSKNRLTGIVS